MDFFRFGYGKRQLVILPGLSVQSVMLSADAIEKAYNSLTNDFTVFVFDRRSELPSNYSIDDMAQDTAQAIIAAGIDRACIFGASQGAMMAVKIAARYPQLAEKLVLASATDRITQADCETFETWIELAKAGKAERLYLSFGEAIYPPDVFDASRSLLIEDAGSVTGSDLRRFVILAGAAFDFDAAEELEDITCPALVIGDTKDRIFGENAAEAVYDRLKKNPGTQLHLYNGCGHALYDTAPDFKERILQFLI
ncbi:MAG: alpha/beta hydrolase [Clostridiales bacterium]|nr:alpha/beta hydrolase [Clostridiales bacterium]